ncbi:MAG TPA: ABC transporter substrate-binding protein [Candidatus Tectomicrobia bacterium]|nr:ABC transporter substrate-binding protein [Candidatus Tectomicrobia bacterium]
MRASLIWLIVTCALSPLWAAPQAEPQPSKPAARIGILSSGFGPIPAREAFRQSLRELGYAEGDSLTYIEHYAEGQLEGLPALAADLVRLEVDVIVAVGHAAVRAAQQATHSIPIVMLIGGDPVSVGLVASLARPGGNITGVTALSPRLSAQRLAFLKEAVPRVTRVAVLFNPDDEIKALDWHQSVAAARAWGVQLQPVEVRSSIVFEEAFAAMQREQVGALIVLTDAVTFLHRTRLVTLAGEHRLPTMYESRVFVEAGGLMAYGPRRADMYRRLAAYVDQILKGAKPADLPIAQPTTFELVINRTTAETLGLTLPPSLLARADEVIP